MRLIMKKQYLSPTIKVRSVEGEEGLLTHSEIPQRSVTSLKFDTNTSPLEVGGPSDGSTYTPTAKETGFDGEE